MDSSQQKRRGFIKGRLFSFPGASKSSSSGQYTSRQSRPNLSSASLPSITYLVDHQDSKPQPRQKVSFLVPAEYDYNYSAVNEFGGYFSIVADENVDTKAASYISSVRERLERSNSERIVMDYYHRYSNEDDRFIRLKSVSLRLSLSSTAAVTCLPEIITLMFLPRINGSLLEINDSKFRPDSPAFVTLHRIPHSEVVFASYDRVRACDGVVFEVHVAENRLLKGVLRRGDDGVTRMECKSMLSKDCGVGEVEVSVASQNGVVLREKVELAVKAKKRRSCRRFKVELEEIPEERECDVAEDGDEGVSDGVCCCSCDESEIESDGGEEIDEDRMMEIEREIEGVGWAVNVGIWVVSLGVGFLVSRASVRNLRRKKFLL